MKVLEDTRSFRHAKIQDLEQISPVEKDDSPVKKGSSLVNSKDPRGRGPSGPGCAHPLKVWKYCTEFLEMLKN